METRNNLILVSSLITLVWCLGVVHVVHGFTYDDKEVETEEGKAGMFERWRSHHKMQSISEKEKQVQFTNFKASLKMVHSTNKANKPYKLEMNRFAGMSHEEVQSNFMGFKSDHRALLGQQISKSLTPRGGDSHLPFRYRNVSLTDIPPKMDWRKVGAVGPVKNQEGCGCCYAFAATCTLEGMQVAIAKKKLVELSPKEIVDCCDIVGGCNGGAMTAAFKWMSENGGLTTMKNYPYEPKKEACRVDKKKDFAAEVHGYEHVPHKDEDALLRAVAHQPVGVAMHWDERMFMYKEGIMTGDDMPSEPMQHAVTAVGYDTAPDGTKYWILKNSWSENWGEKGYMRSLRGVEYHEGFAGIALDGSYPTFDHVKQDDSGVPDPIVKSVRKCLSFQSENV